MPYDLSIEGQMARANDLQQQAFNLQKSQLDKVSKALEDYLGKKGQGFDPKLLTALKSQFLDTNAAAFNDASKTLGGMLSARGEGGGDLPTGGAFTRANSTLLGQQASSTAGGLRDIDIANLQQQLSNRFNAASITAGLPATMNAAVSSFGGASSSALSDLIRQRLNPNSFGNAFSGMLGQAGAMGLAGGLGKVLSNVAPSIFG